MVLKTYLMIVIIGMNSMNVISMLLFPATGILSAIHSGESLFSGQTGFLTWLSYTLIATVIVTFLNKE